MDELVISATANVKQKAARDIGFADVGMARADPADVRFYAEWLARGYAGTMHYLERNIETRRRPVDSPSSSGARSVIAVAENYYTPFEHTPTPDAGKISRYALGEDYHHVVSKNSALLSSKYKQLSPECEAKNPRRYLPDYGQTLGCPRRTRLAGQTFQRHLAEIRLVVFYRAYYHHRRTRPRRACSSFLRRLHCLH